MIYKISFIFAFFFIYAVIGYIVETLFTSTSIKKITFKRGYLFGPYIPIYGIGSLVMSILLTRYKDNIILLFIMGVLICGILEYLTSYLMEKIFNLRWWDYHHSKYNINGRVNLQNSILFGLGGILIIKLINPVLLKIMLKIPKKIMIGINIFVEIIFTIDFIGTTIITSKCKNLNIDLKNIDATEYIKEKNIKFLKELKLKLINKM